MTGRRLGIFILAGVLGVCGGWYAMHRPSAALADQPASQPQVPVTAAPAQVQDVPVFLDGLGTVQAFNVVEIKAQVNGPLIALPAREGQEVHKGDIVAEIDHGGQRNLSGQLAMVCPVLIAAPTMPPTWTDVQFVSLLNACWPIR